VILLAFTLQPSAAAALFPDDAALEPLNIHDVLFVVQIALCSASSTVVAVYMCDEQPHSTSPPPPLPLQSPSQAWPGGAHIQATYGSWSGDDVAWTNRSVTVVAEVLMLCFCVYHDDELFVQTLSLCEYLKKCNWQQQ
jgi:hypothetical protein